MNKKMELTHIDNVWEMLESAKSVDELDNLIGEIPNKFGSFSYEMIDDTTARITNTYEEYGEIMSDTIDICLNTEDLDKYVRVNRVMIYDDMDGFYDCYLFNDYVNYLEVEKVVKEVKSRLYGEWTLEDIQEEICKKFNVKEVIFFDDTGFGNCATIEMNKLEVK